MLTLALFLSLGMMVYGVVRFAIAKHRQQPNSAVHMLWIPCAAFVYAICVTVTVFASMA